MYQYLFERIGNDQFSGFALWTEIHIDPTLPMLVITSELPDMNAGKPWLSPNAVKECLVTISLRLK